MNGASIVPGPPEIVHVAFVHHASFRRTRRRTREEGLFTAAVALPLPVANEVGAPAVCRIVDEAAGADGVPVIVRAHGGRFFKSMTTDDEPMTLDRFREVVVDVSHWTPNPFVELGLPSFRSDYREKQDGAVLDGPGIRDVATDRDECEERLRLAVDGFLVVDGVVHEACLEPVIEVSYGTRHGARISIVIPDLDDERLPVNEEDRRAVFRVDRLGDAVAFLEALRGTSALRSKYGADLDPDDALPAIEVFRADLLARDDGVRLVQDLAPGIVRSLHAFLPLMSKDGLCAFADLREAASALASAPGRTSAEGFMASCAPVRAALEGLPYDEEEDYPIRMKLVDFARVHEGLRLRWERFEGGAPSDGPDADEALARLAV